MKKLSHSQIENINGGVSCLVVGMLAASYGLLSLAVAPMFPKVRECWNS
ncbi:TPA: hypothetical protein ACGZ92_002369 [Elizabethkingia anophelis]